MFCRNEFIVLMEYATSENVQRGTPEELASAGDFCRLQVFLGGPYRTWMRKVVEKVEVDATTIQLLQNSSSANKSSSENWLCPRSVLQMMKRRLV